MSGALKFKSADVARRRSNRFRMVFALLMQSGG